MFCDKRFMSTQTKTKIKHRGMKASGGPARDVNPLSEPSGLSQMIVIHQCTSVGSADTPHQESVQAALPGHLTDLGEGTLPRGLSWVSGEEHLGIAQDWL